MAGRSTVRATLTSAAGRLLAAGVPSPEADARWLLAEVLGIEPGRLALVDGIDDHQLQLFDALIERRASRIPLQHLTGIAYFRHESILVGPGVFVPRPETEIMTGWAIERLRTMIDSTSPAGRDGLEQDVRVVELCTGSGAIAKSIANEVPGVTVHAVELSEEAAGWAARNLSGTAVSLLVQDMTAALPELDGTVDLVIANPPYIPLDAYESVAPEVRDHDPSLALFSGADGLSGLREVAQVATRLLRDGGIVCAEHAELQAESAPRVFTDCGSFTQIQDHLDLARRPRFLSAVRLPRR